VFHDSVDALTKLLTEGEGGEVLERSGISSVSPRIGVLSNGVRHCSVQVKFESGVEYRIEAFGEEADELYCRAREHSASGTFQ
jgi:hypothetical protein